MRREGAPIDRLTFLVLLTAAVAASTAGLHLTFLTETTRTTFAWHIRNPMTAAFFGAAYITAGVAVGSSLLLARRWEELRTASFLTSVFITAAGIVTVVHLGEFQYDSPEPVAQFVSWVWLILYFGLPPALIGTFARQQLRRGAPRFVPAQPLLPRFRAIFVVAGAALSSFGLALVVNAEGAVDLWPWPLPPLSARVAGGWVLVTGLTQLWSVVENDWTKLRVYAYATTLFAPLQCIAAARYADELDGGPRTAVYLAVLASLFALQVAVVVVHRRRYGAAPAVGDAPAQTPAGTA